MAPDRKAQTVEDGEEGRLIARQRGGHSLQDSLDRERKAFILRLSPCSGCLGDAGIRVVYARKVIAAAKSLLGEGSGVEWGQQGERQQRPGLTK